MDYMEIVSHLSDADKTEYAAFTRMFESEGWSFFMEMLTNQERAARDRVFNAKDWDANRIETGKLQALEVMINFEEQTNTLYETVAEDAIEFAEMTEAEHDPL